MKKRAQLMAQPLFFIFALVVGAMILTWGVYTIIQTKGVVEEVEVSTFINRLSEEIETYYYLDEGSTDYFTLNPSNKISYICIKSANSTQTPVPMDQLTQQVLKDNEGFDFVLKNTQRNIFFLPIGITKNNYIISNIIVGPDKNALNKLICKKNNQKITLTSKGTYVQIS